MRIGLCDIGAAPDVTVLRACLLCHCILRLFIAHTGVRGFVSSLVPSNNFRVVLELSTTNPLPVSSCQLTPPSPFYTPTQLPAAHRNHAPRINSSDRLARQTVYFCIDFLFARARGLMIGEGGTREASVVPHGILMEAGNCRKSVSIMLAHRSTKERYSVHTHGD